LFAPHTCIFVLHAHPVRGESYNQRNTTGEVATVNTQCRKRSRGNKHILFSTFTWSVFIVSSPYMKNEWSRSEYDLLSQHTERANALATSTRRRIIMKCVSHGLVPKVVVAVSASLQIKYDCTVSLQIIMLVLHF